MLDKKVVRYTKDGVVEDNLSTGSSQLLTRSAYGKQQHYTVKENVFDPFHHPESISEDQAVSAAVHRAAVRKSKDAMAAAHAESNSPHPSVNPPNSVAPPKENGSGIMPVATKRAATIRAVNERQEQHIFRKQDSKKAERVKTESKRKSNSWIAARFQFFHNRVDTRNSNFSDGHYVPAGMFSASGSVGETQTVSNEKVYAVAAHKKAILKRAFQKAARAADVRAHRNEESDNAGDSAGSAALSDINSTLSGGTFLAVRHPKAILIIFLCILVIGVALHITTQISLPNSSKLQLPEAVEKYRETVSQYAEQYGIPNYSDLILCIMAQESGGSGFDPMQASECGYNTKYPHSPNSIQDPDYSIQCGVQEFAEDVRLAGCTSPSDMDKVKLALQGYNFGSGWFSYASGTYTTEKAAAFSSMMARKNGWDNYGDADYVEHVLRYYLSSGQFTWPTPGHMTLSSPFGYRESTSEFHKGVDISDSGISGTPILAAADGTVTDSATGYGTGYYGCGDGGGFGNHAYIDHGNGYVTIYGHMKECLVKTGDHVSAGQVIGYVGSSGSSTGPHLHFQIMQNDNPVDPMHFFKH